MNIYFFDTIEISKINGISRYREMLEDIFDSTNYTFNLISLDSNSTRVVVSSYKRGIEIRIPILNGRNWRHNGKEISDILSQYIVDVKHTLFILNYSPVFHFLIALKYKFHKSNCIFVIHDQMWCEPLLGDSNKFSQIINNSHNSHLDVRNSELIKIFVTEERNIYKTADCIICLSKCTQDIICNIYKAQTKNLELIPNAFSKTSKLHMDKRDARLLLGLPVNHKIIMCVARDSDIKGLPQLFEAINADLLDLTNVTVIIVGSTPQYNERLKINKAITNSVLFTGFVNRTTLSHIYNAADIGIIPSFSEQCSFVALEMMANGLLIVSSSANGLNNLFIDRVNSFVANIEDYDNLSNYCSNLTISINNALNCNDQTRESFISYNYNLIETYFSIEKIKNKYIELLDKMGGSINIT